jgi:hypothetical protein
MSAAAETIISLLGGRAAIAAAALLITEDSGYTVLLQSVSRDLATDEPTLEIAIKLTKSGNYDISLASPRRYMSGMEIVTPSELAHYVDAYAGGRFARLLSLFPVA